MGLFTKLFSNEQIPQQTNQADNVNIVFEGFGNANRLQSEKISALHAGVDTIAGTIASLKLYKYKENEDGTKERVKCKLDYLLNRSPNNFTTSFDMMDIFITNAIFEGNGYILIKRNNKFEVEKLIPLKHGECYAVEVVGSDEVKYQVSKTNYVGTYEHFDIINLALNSDDGIHGKGILKYGSEILGLATNIEKYNGSMINSGTVKNIITTPNDLTAEQRAGLAERVRNFVKGNNGTLVLPDSMKFESINSSPADLELLKQKEFTVEEIGRLLKIPMIYLGVSSGTSQYKSLEETQIMFYKNTIQPYLIRIQELINLSLLTEQEKMDGYYFEYDTSAIMKISAESTMNYLQKGIDAGVYSINEARQILNLNIIDGLDIHTLSKFNSIFDKEKGQITNTIMNEVVDGVRDVVETTTETI